MDMDSKGIKRKTREYEGWVDGDPCLQCENYPVIRQSMLNMSLDKFNKGRMLIEPSLRRYVLIANTLRLIEEEIKREPCAVPVLDSRAIPSGNMATLSQQSSTVMMESRVPALPEDIENILLPGVEGDLPVSSSVASILRELENVLDEAAPQHLLRLSANQDPQVRVEQSLNITVPLNLNSVHQQVNDAASRKENLEKKTKCTPKLETSEDSKDIELIKELVLAVACTETLPELPVAMDTSTLEEVSREPCSDSSGAETPNTIVTLPTKEEPSMAQTVKSISTARATETIFGSFEIMSSSYLNDVSFDDPFSDIDTSVFEREVTSLGSVSGSRFCAQDEPWYPSCNSASYSSGQGLRDSNDLDNIMEILVGS
ncbi:SERTA domain-containing protein 2-like isoform X2 [Bombina bombina]|nr:SERTA domain-containing protein 2-like isoform X2 [Bombina bombina]